MLIMFVYKLNSWFHDHVPFDNQRWVFLQLNLNFFANRVEADTWSKENENIAVLISEKGIVQWEKRLVKSVINR